MQFLIYLMHTHTRRNKCDNLGQDAQGMKNQSASSHHDYAAQDGRILNSVGGGTGPLLLLCGHLPTNGMQRFFFGGCENISAHLRYI